MTRWKRGDWVRCNCSDPAQRCPVAGTIKDIDFLTDHVILVGFNLSCAGGEGPKGRWSQSNLLRTSVTRFQAKTCHKLGLVAAIMRGEVEY